MKKIFLLFLIFFANLHGGLFFLTDVNKRLFSKDIKEVQEAIKEGANVNVTIEYDCTALMKAIMDNNLEITKFLINSGADLNARNFVGGTALMFAAGFNRVEIVKLLIDAEADLNAKDDYGETALMTAEENENTEIAELIKNKIEYLRKPELDFIKAAQEGNVKELAQMIERGVDINAQDENGFTALMRASQAFLWSTPPYSKEIKDELQGKLKIVKILLDQKVDFTPKDNVMHWTALRWALESGNNQAEALLKAAGARE